MRSLLMMIGMLSSGCAHPVKLKSYYFKRPPNTWFTRPVPCEFTEVGQVVVQEWSYELLTQYISRIVNGQAVDAVIDFTVEKVVLLEPMYTEDGLDSEYWRGVGLAVKWTDPGCAATLK